MTDPDSDSPPGGIPRVYYLDEIAAVWKVEVRYLADKLRSGKFRGVKLGGKWAMTEAQMAAALEALSNRRQRTASVEAEEWKPPYGITPRSWAYHQRYPDGNPNLRKPKGPRKKPAK